MYFEDFHAGLGIITPQRTVPSRELEAFLDIAELHLPMFLSDERARELGHPRRLVTGPMILAVAMGLVHATGWFDQVIAALEFDHMRFLKAVHPGDTLQVHLSVLETRPTRDPERGLVILSFDITKQKVETVLEMKGTYLFRTMHTGNSS